MHVARLATDEGFVCFDLSTVPADLHHRTVRHCLADAMEHEPCGFLSHAKRTGDLAGANAILRSGNEPHSGKPFFQTERRILKDGSNLGGELALRVAALALPFLLVLQLSHVLAPTGGAEHALRPAMVNHVPDAVIGIGKIENGLLQSLRCFHG